MLNFFEYHRQRASSTCYKIIEKKSGLWKPIILTALGLIYSSSSSLAQSFFSPEDNTSFIITGLDDMEKYTQQSTVTYKVGLNFTEIHIKGEGILNEMSRISYDYSYTLQKISGGFKFGIEAVMNPEHTAYNKTRVIKTYNGNSVFYPEVLQQDMILDDASGVITLNLQASKTEIKQSVKLTNRKVTRSEMLEWRGAFHKVWVISSKYMFTTMIENKEDRIEMADLEEWIIPEVGIIKTTRRVGGNTIHTIIK